MAQFDQKTWNPNVFQKYLTKVPNEHLYQFVKNGVFKQNQNLASKLKEDVGGNYIEEPIKGILNGEVTNYDGVSNIAATSRETFKQGKIVVGRAKGFVEKDFSTDISGAEFLPTADMAGEVGEYFQGVDQDDILAILEGIFKMSDTEGAKFVEKHTYDVTGKSSGTVGASTLNRAITKASGDHKNIFTMVYMDSFVAADYEDLQLLNYFTYTDAMGIQRDLALATLNGRTVIIDDDCPVQEGYYAAASTDTGALQVVASGASTGEINLADVKKGDFYPAGVAASDYVVAGNKHVSYILGKGFIEYADCGAKVPNEMDRDPATNGGKTTLYVRQRHLYAPKYISFTKASMSTESPTTAELATGSNWEIVNNGQSGANKAYIKDKLIPVARIMSKVSE